MRGDAEPERRRGIWCAQKSNRKSSLSCRPGRKGKSAASRLCFRSIALVRDRPTISLLCVSCVHVTWPISDLWLDPTCCLFARSLNSFQLLISSTTEPWPSSKHPAISADSSVSSHSSSSSTLDTRPLSVRKFAFTPRRSSSSAFLPCKNASS